jgi:hypothetical protein
MKYRVIEINKKFYPQYKGLWWWSYFYEHDCFGGLYKESFSELSDAIEAINKNKDEIKVKVVYIDENKD